MYNILKKSVLFFTFHKTATSLFASYVFPNIKNLKPMNMAGKIYKGNYDKKVRYLPFGHIYGPIRLSVNRESPVNEYFVEPLTSLSSIKNKKCIFMIRDPRDILISSYYSFGYSHSFSPVKKIRDLEISERKRIQSMSIDEYVRSEVKTINENFKLLSSLKNNCGSHILISYEEMILDFESFKKKISNYIKLDELVYNEIFERTRPRMKENMTQHKRSGKIASYLDKLDSSTIDYINHILKPIINEYQYELVD